MRQLHIPTIGEEITLAADWTFTVHNEYRNSSLIEWMGEKKGDHYSFPLGAVPTTNPGVDSRIDWEKSENKTTTCTLPKGTKLRIDRIYIRKNLKDFDSVTFFLKGAKTVQKKRQRTMVKLTAKPGSEQKHPWNREYDREEIPYTQTVPARPVRFWAKLADANRIKIK